MSDEAIDTSEAAVTSVMTDAEEQAAETEDILTGDENTDNTDKSTDKSGDDGEKTGDDESKVDDAEGKDEASTGDEVGYTLQEGIELSDEEKGEIDALFTDAQLKPDQQQKVIDFMTKQTQAGQQAQSDSINQLVQGWAKECINDKEFGGDNFKQNQGIAKTAIDTFGSPELKNVLNETGMKNNPDLFRFMVKVGMTLKEDNPGGEGTRGSSPKSTVEELYPNDNNNKS